MQLVLYTKYILSLSFCLRPRTTVVVSVHTYKIPSITTTPRKKIQSINQNTRRRNWKEQIHEYTLQLSPTG